MHETASIFYNTQHSPIGAFASFTLGARGAKGGLAIELGRPANQNIFVGLENSEQEGFTCLPFFDQAEDGSLRFDVSAAGKAQPSLLHTFKPEDIRRELSPQRDSWIAGELTFSIFTPVCPAPSPSERHSERKLAYAPALAIELSVDNREGAKARRIIFGYQGNDPYRNMRRLTRSRGLVAGVANGDTTAIASNDPGIFSAQGFTAEEILEDPHLADRSFGLGEVGLLIGSVPAGSTKTFRFVACFYRGGIVTTGMRASYYYSRFFPDIESVASYALDNFSPIKKRGSALERRFQKSAINPARKFMLAQAIHSYFGSTELLDVAGDPMWIVNEGEYRMMNTLDLTVDQLFFEIAQNPWTVGNELDWFVKRYSFRDKARFPGGDKDFPGGISFTHDMGVANHFSPPQSSVYERSGLTGCFSQMTHEELVNWLTCALVYAHKSGDKRWVSANLKTIKACFQSLLQRDHPESRHRDGVMSLDSSRCGGGAEITTYDSLDVSLGQARNNLYLAVKCWGIYAGLQSLFEKLKDEKNARLAKEQATRASNTILASADENGLFPAILNENISSRIIPAIEGLIIPYALGLKKTVSVSGVYGDLIRALKTHLAGILQPGICLFPEGSWKISSTSDNSWLSKVYLCQFIAEQILDFPASESTDQIHASWLLNDANSYWAWGDQMVAGELKGSRYYPRGVTSILWLDLD